MLSPTTGDQGAVLMAATRTERQTAVSLLAFGSAAGAVAAGLRQWRRLRQQPTVAVAGALLSGWPRRGPPLVAD